MATLAQLVARYRSQLDDLTADYLWEDQELTDYYNRVANEVCRQIPLIEDRTTALVCVIPVVTGTASYALSDRVVWIKRAKLTSQASPLPTASADHMDNSYDNWESASNDAPTLLLTEGVGTNVIRLYPPPDANDTLTLTVTRLPLTDLVYATDSALPVEIPSKVVDFLCNGVYAYAYLKQDADTYDLKKAEMHMALFRQDIESIKRTVLKFNHKNMVLAPMRAFS